MNLDAEVLEYWHATTFDRITYDQPSTVCDSEKKLYIFLSKIRTLIEKQKIFWCGRNADTINARLRTVGYRFESTRSFLFRSNTSVFKRVAYTIHLYEEINRTDILKCFTLPRGKGATPSIIERIKSDKEECIRILEAGFTISQEDFDKWDK